MPIVLGERYVWASSRLRLELELSYSADCGVCVSLRGLTVHSIRFLTRVGNWTAIIAEFRFFYRLSVTCFLGIL